MTVDTMGPARSPLAEALSEALHDAPPAHAARGVARDWWRHLGARGLLALGFDADGAVPPADACELSALAALIARESASLGAATAWLSNQLIGGLVLAPHARSEAHHALLCAMARGEALVALAFCDAGAGAQPALPACRATRDGDGWTLEGHEAFVPQGAAADAFVVLAADVDARGRLGVDAFVVAADAPGLSREPAVWIAGLDSHTHCGLHLAGVRVDDAQRLGEPGRAMADIARPLRTIDEALRIGPMLGAMHAELDAIALWLRTVPPARRPTRHLGALQIELEALAPLAAHAARHLDLHGADERLAALCAGTHEALARWQSAFESFAAPLDDHGPALPSLVRDLRRMLGLSRRGTEARQRRAGEAMIGIPGRHSVPALAAP
jgi:acyl-CoA dehydrogenase